MTSGPRLALDTWSASMCVSRYGCDTASTPMAVVTEGARFGLDSDPRSAFDALFALFDDDAMRAEAKRLSATGNVKPS